MPLLTDRLVEHAPRRLRPAVRVLVRTGRGVAEDRLPGLAAEIAFWVLLSLPALLVAAIAAVSLIAGLDGADWHDQLIARIVEVSRLALTGPTVEQAVEPLLRRLVDSSSVGVVSLGFITAVWTASRAVKVVLATTVLVYGRAEARKGWEDRLLGFGVTLGLLLVGTVMAPLLLAGPGFGATVEDWFDIDLGVLAEVWSAAYWPTMVVGVTLTISVLFHLGVPGRTPWRDDVPGAVLATSVWLAGSAGLRLYGTWVLDSDSVYGPLAGPIVALLWLWLTGFAVLLGAQLNARLARERGDADEALTAPVSPPPGAREDRRPRGDRN